VHIKHIDRYEKIIKQKHKDNQYQIISYHNGIFQFSQADAFVSKPGHHLIIERHHNFLARIIHDKQIVALTAPNFKEVLIKLMQHVTVVQTSIPYEKTLDELMLRELETPTIIGDEVAIPHSYCKELKESLCIIGKLENEIIMTDKKHIRLVFLLLSPPNEPKMHLQLLSSIARLVSANGVVEKLMQAKNKMDIIECIDENIVN
jgi:PTS system nitrogen regulatory IIA component